MGTELIKTRAEPRIVKVIGPPGTGKTTFGLDVVLDAILERGVHPTEIVYTTFTRSGAAEARGRVLEMSNRLDLGFTEHDFPYFRTAHAICKQLLDIPKELIFADKWRRQFGRTCGYEFSDQHDDSNEPEIRDVLLKTTGDYLEFFISWWSHCFFGKSKEMAAAFSQFKDQMNPTEAISWGNVLDYLDRRQRFLAENTLCDFSDMLLRCLGRFHPGHRLMIWDEAQDNSPLLHELMRWWFRGTEQVYIIGDPDQSIFDFIGAVPELFLILDSDEEIPLTVGHRLPQEHIDFANTVITRNRDRYPHPGFSPTNIRGWVSTYASMDEETWGAFVYHVRKTGDRIFFAHRTRWLLNRAFDTLIEQGIPFATNRGRHSPLETNEKAAVSTWLRLINGNWVSPRELLRATEKFLYGSQLKRGTKARLKRMVAEYPEHRIMKGELHSMGFQETGLFYTDTFLAALKMGEGHRSYFDNLIKQWGANILEGDPPVFLSTIHGLKGMECAILILNTETTKKVDEGLMRNPQPENRLWYVALTRAKEGIILLEPELWRSFSL